MQGFAGSFKIGVNRKKILPVMVMVMLLSITFIGLFFNVEADHPSYIFGGETTYVDHTVQVIGAGGGGFFKVNDSCYLAFWVPYTNAEIRILNRTTNANFTTGDDVTLVTDNTPMVMRGGGVYKDTSGVVYWLFADQVAGSHYDLAYINSDGTDMGTWTGTTLRVETAGKNKPSCHVVEFNSEIWFAWIDGDADPAKLYVYNWSNTGPPNVTTPAFTIDIAYSASSNFYILDLVEYHDDIYLFCKDVIDGNLTYRLLSEDFDTQHVVFGDASVCGHRSCVVNDSDNDVIALIIANESDTKYIDITTFNGTSWSANYTIVTGGYQDSANIIDGYFYLTYNTVADNTVMKYQTNHTGEPAGGGGDAEISVSCSGLSGPIGGNNTHINFVTTNDSKTNVDSDEWINVSYAADNGNSSITELHILWNATIGGQVASLDNLHMCIWTVAGEPTNLNYNQSSWNYVDQFTTGNSGNITVNSSNWSGAVGSTFDYGESIYFMFRIDSLGSLAIGSYSNSASSHKVYITGQTG